MGYFQDDRVLTGRVDEIFNPFQVLVGFGLTRYSKSKSDRNPTSEIATPNHTCMRMSVAEDAKSQKIQESN